MFHRLVQWRVGIPWYLVALILPVLISATTAGLSLLLRFPGSFHWQAISALSIVVFVLVVGEEVGWRGFALPRMLQNWPALSASLVLGLLWGLWHLPTFFIPGLPQAGIPFAAYLIFVISLSVLFTWLFRHTGGSLQLPWRIDLF